jgi:prepilin-type N-terminal cleavage/methylation domain-containing protein
MIRRGSVRSAGYRAGFSLVELSLAILVVAVGLLAAYGLFPSGLNAGKRALDESQAGIFAEEVIGAIQAVAEDPQVSWSDLDTLSLPGMSEPGLPPPGANLWENSLELLIKPNMGMRTNKYQLQNKLFYDYVIRYDLQIGDLPGRPLKAVRLETWNGEYGPTNESLVFYTELYQTGH